MAKADISSFSGLRSYLWPIHAHEAKKLIPMTIMIAFVALNYSILRGLKDTLLITEPGAGAEVLPFVKLWVMLPAAIVSTMVLSYLLNHFSKTAVFTTVSLLFFAFFLAFAFFIYPYRSMFHLHTSANYLESVLPFGFKGFVTLYRHWTLTCFYVIAELWGTIVLQVLMWGVINEITKVSEAPRFHGVLVIACNIAAICAGQIANALKPIAHSLDGWNIALTRLALLITALGCISLAAFYWMAKYIFTNPAYTPQEEKEAKKSPKKKLSFKESLYHIANSKYLLCIASIVVSYNLVINLVEVLWKDRLHRYCPNPGDFNTYTNNITTAVGIISTIASVLMLGIIQRLGWTKTALLTPMVLLITSSAFFICLFGGGGATLGLAVFLGSAQNCISKGAKYSVFDATKEMAFVPLESDHKMKGKAAIDGIGSRMAKSGGSILQQGLLLFCGTLAASAPYIALIVGCVTALWFFSILTLGKEYQKLTEEKEEEVAAIA